MSQDRTLKIWSGREDSNSGTIAEAVGSSHEAVRSVLKRTGRFASRIALRKKPRIERGCSVPGCGRKHRGRGYCGPHLARINAGTMDEKGNPVPVRRKCRICHKIFYAARRSAGRKMCDKCRPTFMPQAERIEEFARRRKRVVSLYKRGTPVGAIAHMIQRSPWTVWMIMRQAASGGYSSQQTRVRAGLCGRCGERRNGFAFHCDGCHQALMVKQRNRLRLRYRQLPRCNAIGCRSLPVIGAFCRNCHSAWRRGEIDSEGKHALCVCKRCSCKFIPDRKRQKRCRACQRKAYRSLKHTESRIWT